ncbi:hypothetical protein SEUCBS139899_006716 [Sporothrix eucalyptigena]
MKFTQLVSLLALGLGARPVAASVCKPSKASSSSSAAPSPSASAVVCDPNANLLQNGDFADGLNDWEYQDNTFLISDCGPYTSCVQINFGGGTDTISQTVDTFVGETYTISLDFNVLYLNLDNGGWIYVEIGDGSTIYTTWTLDPTVNGWVSYSNSFVATSTTTEVTLLVYDRFAAQVDFANVFINTICGFTHK